MAFLLLLCGLPFAAGNDAAFPTAAPESQPGILRFKINDSSGQLIPGRLTFVGSGGAFAELFSNTAAAPDELAVRRNIIYSKSGQGAVTVPAGRYTVYASRGLEWSVDSAVVDIVAGGSVDFDASLRHEVDTSGWVSGDFHLHTLTHSGHGDSNMKERVITFLGEGLEFAVATDHNHNTDYHPTMKALGVTELTAVTGNEVSVPIGHFNAFPLEPDRAVPPPDALDANALFQMIRAEPNRYGVKPVIQVNHPRWDGIDYFTIGELDPQTGVPGASLYSDDFDSIEVLNENTAWGYYDAEHAGTIHVAKSRYWALRDWFNLLNRGHRYAAVGNSDSHTVHDVLAAYPRNFVRSSTDAPARISVAEVARSIREKQLFTSVGPFVTYTVNDVPMGGTVETAEPMVEIKVKVQAASWVDCDRVKVVVNGDVIYTVDVADTRQVVRLDARIQVPIRHDSWLTLLVEGDDALAPIVHDQGRPVRPVAVMNPVWINKGGGAWTSPLAHARSLISEGHIRGAKLTPSMRALVTHELPVAHPEASAWIRRGLAAEPRVERLAAAVAARKLRSSELIPDLIGAYVKAQRDTYLGKLCLQAIQEIDPTRGRSLAFSFVEAATPDEVHRYAGDVLAPIPAVIAREWEAVGYFANPDASTVLSTAYPPEAASAQQKSFSGRDGSAVEWTMLTTNVAGFCDLRRLGPTPNNAIAYARCQVFSPQDREVYFAAGSDDGCRLWLNGTVIYEAAVRRGARPFQHVAAMRLNKGWNHVLIKVENGGGAFGHYFRLFDDEVRISARQGPPR